MEYRNLGDSGLKVSRLGYGNWRTGNEAVNKPKVLECMKFAFESGINFFDTAEMYGNGQGEKIFGDGFEEFDWDREEFVVTTKLFNDVVNDDPNNVGCSRKHLMEGINKSLKNLKLDYVDVLYCHRFDHTTPIEEVCRGMNDIIEEGQAIYWGTSEWDASEIREAHAVCARTY